MSDRYSFSLTTFSPSGKLVQIEYALEAVASGLPSIGIKATNGVVLATEKSRSSTLSDLSSVEKISKISNNMGMVYSGFSSDSRQLVKFSRKLCQSYSRRFGKTITPISIVSEIALSMQEYTQQGGVRPYGCSLLIAGWDKSRNIPLLYQCDPSGTYFAWKATALGQNYVGTQNFLKVRYNDELELEDAIHMAILALKSNFEGVMDGNNIEIAVCDEEGFRNLTPEEISDYLSITG
ncbi:Proteasome subunit alpha type-2 [Intoshia linei]|uniref:Proteasome subunit alpha type n=1 Tax=Intoshia linei TaxID=1819745 RepID=A0A177BF39_9BILA|nr:Proteasome subunit alpha type-2 [Intoshia linei]